MSPKFVLGGIDNAARRDHEVLLVVSNHFVPFPALNNCNMISQVKPKFDGPTSPRMGESKHVTDSRLLKVCFFFKGKAGKWKKRSYNIYCRILYIYTLLNAE